MLDVGWTTRSLSTMVKTPTRSRMSRHDRSHAPRGNAVRTLQRPIRKPNSCLNLWATRSVAGRLPRRAWELSVITTPISQTTPNAPSGGRAESLWKGLSGMDAARAAMGQGWPFAACPWNDDGAREPDEVGPDAWGQTFCLLLGRLPKVSRCKIGTGISNNIEAASSR